MLDIRKLQTVGQSAGVPPQEAAAEQPRALVRFENVSKSFDGRSKVVDRLDLDVHKGEFLTLLGPSGSGKTTTLMMLAGFEDVSDGQISINGRSINRLPSYKRNIGVVFQNYALFPHMTIGQNVAFPLRHHNYAKEEIDGRVAKALEMVRLERLESRYPKQLSGGQQQRVALARALVFEPTLVLMDEPLGALDRRLREHMQIEIKQLHASIGMTIIYVTHDQSEALTMSDRIAIFNHGRIEQIASPQDVYERPATSFVAHFIGDNNSLHGVVAEISTLNCLVELVGGERIKAEMADTVAIGDHVEVTVRPDSIVPAATIPRDNQLLVTVNSVIYNGDQTLLICGLSQERSLLIRIPSRTMQEVRPTPGETMRVGWDQAAGRVFRTAGGSLPSVTARALS